VPDACVLLAGALPVDAHAVGAFFAGILRAGILPAANPDDSCLLDFVSSRHLVPKGPVMSVVHTAPPAKGDPASSSPSSSRSSDPASCSGPTAAFRPGLNAAEVHAFLQEALAVLRCAEKNAVLWFAEIRQRQLYRRLGYSSLHQYAGEALGFSKSKTSQFIRLAEALDELPLLRESLAKGELSWTKAREVAKVATKQSQEQWVDEAKHTSNRELERKVAATRARARSQRSHRGQGTLAMGGEGSGGGNGQNGQDQRDSRDSLGGQDGLDGLVEVPVTVNLRFAPDQYARYEALVEALHKKATRRGRTRRNGAGPESGSGAALLGLSREELVLAALAELLAGACGTEGTDRSGAQGPDRGSADKDSGTNSGSSSLEFTRVNSSSPYQIVIYKCDVCGRGQVETSQGSRELKPAKVAAAECDAKVLVPGRRNRVTIPAALRRAVLVRDRHRCQMPGCGRTRFLEVHHKVARSVGGKNCPDNLITLCSACYQLQHEHGMAVGALRSLGECSGG
jgi:hypothetical protein